MLFAPKPADTVYDTFEQQVALACEAADLLEKLFERLPAPQDKLEELSKRIRRIEQESDTLTHESVAQLHKTWITPFDRSHIHGLLGALDDIVDRIDSTSDYVVLFGMEAASAETRSLAHILVETTETVRRAIRLLRTLRTSASDLVALCVEINRLENEGDRVYRSCVARMLQAQEGAQSPCSVGGLRWREIVDSLESAIDRCERVAHLLEATALEYA